MNDTTEINLKNVAQMAAEQFKSELQTTEAEDKRIPNKRTASIPMESDDDDEFVMIENPIPKPKAEELEATEVIQEEVPSGTKTPIAVPLSEDMGLDSAMLEAPISPLTPNKKEGLGAAEELFRDAMRDMPTAEVDSLVEQLLTEVESETRNLMAQFAIPEDTAREGAIHKGIDRATAANRQWLRDNPQVGVIEIKKTDEEFIQLNEEEHKKLEKVNTIRLVLVEDEELKHISIENVKPELKVDYIRSLDTGLSKFTVPLPILGDNVTFKGAQIVQLVQAILPKTMGEDDEETVNIEESIRNKASLVYERLVSGAFLKKYDEKGRNVLTFSQFANIMPYQDLDLALYAILVASSTEQTKSSLVCEKCGDRDHPYEFTYNVKGLLDLSDLSDRYKERVDIILAAGGNPELAKEHHDSFAKAHRYRSPYTGNVYELSHPSIARAINLFQRIDQNDEVMMYNSTPAMFLNAVMIPTTNGAYVRVGEDEISALMETMQSLPDEDVKMLLDLISDQYLYLPKFVLKTTCPRCGHYRELTVSVEEMVFLRAQII